MKKHSKTWGGKRVGSGRKRKNETLVTYSVHISNQQAELLKMWGGGCIDLGLRWLIDIAEIVVSKTR